MDKQKEIQKFLSKVKTATLEEIAIEFKTWYYMNNKKYIGIELNKMIKKRIVKRVKIGTYELTNPDFKEQGKLF